jgi:hypothetical protein
MRHSTEKAGHFAAVRQADTGKTAIKEGRVSARGRTWSIQFDGERAPVVVTVKNIGASFRGRLKASVVNLFRGSATAGSTASVAMDVIPAAEVSVFTETGAFLTEPALKAFAEGMKNVKPTEALVAAMARAKSIRRA